MTRNFVVGIQSLRCDTDDGVNVEMNGNIDLSDVNLIVKKDRVGSEISSAASVDRSEIGLPLPPRLLILMGATIGAWPPYSVL